MRDLRRFHPEMQQLQDQHREAVGDTGRLRPSSWDRRTLLWASSAHPKLVFRSRGRQGRPPEEQERERGGKSENVNDRYALITRPTFREIRYTRLS